MIGGLWKNFVKENKPWNVMSILTRHHYSCFTAKIHWLDSLIALNPLQVSWNSLARCQGLSWPLARSGPLMFGNIQAVCHPVLPGAFLPSVPGMPGDTKGIVMTAWCFLSQGENSVNFYSSSCSLGTGRNSSLGNHKRKKGKGIKEEIETNILYSGKVSMGLEGGLRPAFIVFWLWFQGSH